MNRSNHFKISSGYIGCEIGIHITANCQNVIIETVNICDSSQQGAGIWIERAEHTIIRDPSITEPASFKPILQYA